MAYNVKRKWKKSGEELLLEIEQTNSTDNLYTWYIGQCGYIFKYKDIVIAIDPVLNDLCNEAGESVRNYPSPFSSEQLKVDLVLCTHDHADHLAPETVEGLLKNKDALLIIPEGCKGRADELGIDSKQVIGLNDKEIKALQIRGTEIIINGISTAHPEHNVDSLGRDTNLAYSIIVGGKRILHLGDTYLTSRLLKELEQISNLDLFIAPINGRDIFRESRGIIGNMEAEEVANLASMMRPGLTIPSHYDMVEGNTVDPCRFVSAIYEIDNSIAWKLPVLGECIIW